MGFGHLAAEALVQAVAAKAKRHKVAIGGVVNSTHIGCLGEWSELAADLGVLCFLCAATAEGWQAAPYGGAEARLGTNPMTFAAPAAEDDLTVLDFSTTASAEGKIRVYRDRGEPLPEGWLLDQHGNPSTDANDLYDGGLMLCFGKHKGYGLSVMVSILAANLVASAQPDLERDSGVFGLAMDPGAFGDAQAVLQGVQRNLERLRRTRPAAGFSEVLAPGDYERRSREATRGQPIELPEATWRLFLDAARQVGLDPGEIGLMAAGG